MWTRCKNHLQKPPTRPRREPACAQAGSPCVSPLAAAPHRYLLAGAAPAWHFISLSACSHFLTLLSDISTASLRQINKREHSPICMWPRFLCFLQFLLIVSLLFSHQRKYFTDIMKTLFPATPNYQFMEMLYSPTHV